MFYLGYRKVLLQNGGGFQYIIEGYYFPSDYTLDILLSLVYNSDSYEKVASILCF